MRINRILDIVPIPVTGIDHNVKLDSLLIEMLIGKITAENATVKQILIQFLRVIIYEEPVFINCEHASALAELFSDNRRNLVSDLIIRVAVPFLHRLIELHVRID